MQAVIDQLTLTISLTIIGIIVLALSMLAIAWVADSISSPIKALTQSINRYADSPASEFKPIEINNKHITTDLLELIEAFNKMAENRSQMEKVLILHEEALLAKNADLEQFAAIASHDLQEPLRKIQAFGNLLQQRYAAALDERGLDYLTRMQKASERMSLLIKDLLLYSRIKNNYENFKSVSLNQIVSEVLTDLEMSIEQSHAQITMTTMPDIDADATQIRQLFQNLISNSIKFRRTDITPVINIQANLIKAADATKQLCELIISDNGIGFEMIYTEKIFEVFQRLHNRWEYPGTGIGLAICKKIVQRHGGSISVTSKINHGTTFTVLLRTKHALNNQLHATETT